MSLPLSHPSGSVIPLIPYISSGNARHFRIRIRGCIKQLIACRVLRELVIKRDNNTIRDNQSTARFYLVDIPQVCFIQM